MSTEHVCEDCGESFDSNHALKTHSGIVHTPDYQKEGMLRRLYEDEDMSIAEIAAKYECSNLQIQRWMDKHDIKTEKAPQDPTTPPYHGFETRGTGRINYEYEAIQTRVAGELYTISVHRLIAIAHGKLEADDMWNYKYDVHHKSGHGLDNRPENLEVLTRSEHRSRHEG